MTGIGDASSSIGLLVVVERDALRVCGFALKGCARRPVSQCPVQPPIRLHLSNAMRLAGFARGS